MSELIYFHPAIFKNQHLEIPGLSNLMELQRIFPTQNGIKDRTGTITTPFKQTVLNPLPEFKENSSITYQECAMKRVAELEKIQNAKGKTFRLMYSGGIDSTGIFAAFVDYFGIDKTSKILEICCNKESIYENPWVWDRYISKHNFKLISSHKHTDLWEDNVITLMGEGNDQLLGNPAHSITWAKFVEGVDVFRPADEDTIRYYFNNHFKITSEVTIANTIKVINAAPYPLENMCMVLWWLFIALQWDPLMLRVLSQSNKNQFSSNFLDAGLPQFYNTLEFQNWGLNYIKNFKEEMIFDVKSPTKDMILDVLDVPEYIIKTKTLSFPRLHSMVPHGLMIDDKFKMYRNLENFLPFIDPNNSFV